jgi:hypothetical protein
VPVEALKFRRKENPGKNVNRTSKKASELAIWKNAARKLRSSRREFQFPMAGTGSSAIKHFLDLAYFLLHPSFRLVGAPFRFKPFVAGYLPCAFLDVSLGFLGRTFDLVMSAVFHVFVGLWV